MYGQKAYVRARILADSNYAQWLVTSEMQFETNAIVGSGFEKAAGESDNTPPPTQDIFNVAAYPNSFNPSVSVAYTISSEDANGNVNITLTDIMGRQIGLLYSGVQSAGDSPCN